MSVNLKTQVITKAHLQPTYQSQMFFSQRTLSVLLKHSPNHKTRGNWLFFFHLEEGNKHTQDHSENM